MPKASKIAVAEKERIFVLEFLVDFNAIRAATAAGYKASGATNQAVRMLKTPHIVEAIKRRVDVIAARADVTVDNVIREIARIAFANMHDYISIGADGEAFVDMSTVDRDKAAAIAEIIVDKYNDGGREVKRTRFKLHDKRGALNDLYRHLTGQKFGDTFVQNNIVQINSTLNALSVSVTQDDATKAYTKLLEG